MRTMATVRESHFGMTSRFAPRPLEGTVAKLDNPCISQERIGYIGYNSVVFHHQTDEFRSPFVGTADAR